MEELLTQMMGEEEHKEQTNQKSFEVQREMYELLN